VASIGLLFGVLIGVLMTLFTRFFPEQTIGLLTDEAAVITEGSRYLRIVCFSYLLFAVTNVSLAALRSVETVKIGFAVTLAALVVNVVLNYGLIYGRLGMPELGVEGAAIATLVSRIVEFCVVVGYISPWLLTIVWGKDYAQAASVFRYLLPVLAISFPVAILGWPVLGAIDKTKHINLSTLVGALTQILGLVGLYVIGKFTIINVAIIRNISEFTMFLVLLIYVLKYRKLFSLEKNIEKENAEEIRLQEKESE
jgi:Na+-driven multidrug efflux pump